MEEKKREHFVEIKANEEQKSKPQSIPEARTPESSSSQAQESKHAASQEIPKSKPVQQEPIPESDSEEKFLHEKSAKLELTESELLRKRKDSVVKFIKKYYNWISYIILAVIVFISVKIRTRNLSGLKDVSTGTWTLGPDLDPFLFLRWAKYIVEHGALFAIDTMRYVPLGFDVKKEALLHPYLMAWFHKVALLFGSESVTHSAVIFPVFMFALTVIAFFFLSRKIFMHALGEKNANIIALISSFFLTVLPPLLPRTIAGIPEKESAAFFFLFLAFYFFLSAWESKKLKSIFLAALAGISTAAMALIWGGYAFIYLTMAPAFFLAFILDKVDKQKLYLYSIWLISSFAIMFFGSPVRYSVKNLVSQLNTAPALVVLLIISFHIFIFNPYLKKYFASGKLAKVPSKITSTIIASVLAIIVSIIFLGTSFITSHISAIIANLVRPATSRLIQTVAENRQPFFTEWGRSFGPIVKNIPLFFWLFFTGSIYLFYKMIYILRKKERFLLTASYTIFLFTIIFSRYSSDSVLNGTNTTSLLLYSFGFIIFILTIGFYYYRYDKKGEAQKLKNIEFSFILLFTFFFLSILAARGLVRLIMVLVPPASIVVSYFVVASFNDVIKMKDNTFKIISWIIIGILILATVFAGYGYYKVVNSQAGGYIPSGYTQQWQRAMSWVRGNTQQNAVFGHWWDYGYWLQSIGERSTILDGGNTLSYWNHLMGRHGLTGTNDRDSLEFLYAHQATHFLIDSTDIGKYGAFSSIGSDINYDRRSWIPTFLRDNNQVQETKNSTIFFYPGGTGIDEDIIYETDEARLFLPAGKAGIGAILIEINEDGKIENQPQGIFVYQGQQHRLPLRYAFFNGDFLDFGSGVESGAFLFPRASQNNIEPEGAMMYLSQRTVKSQLARLYLYKENNPNFKLVHNEDDFVVSQIKAQNPQISDIIFFNGVRGPIRIWEINYPADIELKEEYLEIEYPEELQYG